MASSGNQRQVTQVPLDVLKRMGPTHNSEPLATTRMCYRLYRFRLSDGCPTFVSRKTHLSNASLAKRYNKTETVGHESHGL